MISDKRDYHAYLLRLWRVKTDHSQVWHVSLEDPETGERKGFADLRALLAFLEEQTNSTDQSTVSEKGGEL